MPPRIKLADAIDIIGFRPLFRETVKGFVFGSIEWERSIGGIMPPSPEEAFRISPIRVQEKFDRIERDGVDLPSPAPVQVSTADTDGLRRVIFSVEPGLWWKSLRISVAGGDDAIWDYPEVRPEMRPSQVRVG